MGFRFKQLHLGDMEFGLAKELAVFSLSPQALSELRGIRFELTKDDLDYVYAALLATEDDQQFALRSYLRGPHSDKTELVGNECSMQPQADLKKFLAALQIPDEVILWSIGKS